MKKLVAIAVLTAAFASPAAAQYVYSMPHGDYYGYEPRGYDEVYIYASLPVYGSPALITPRGVMSDSDPNVRSEIRRNYNHYLNMNQ